MGGDSGSTILYYTVQASYRLLLAIVTYCPSGGHLQAPYEVMSEDCAVMDSSSPDAMVRQNLLERLLNSIKQVIMDIAS